MNTTNLKNKIAGTLIGSAIGDGFGYPTEFLKVDEMIEKWGIEGLTAPLGNPIKVTDDTQMALAVAKALQTCWQNNKEINPDSFEKTLVFRYSEWLNDPENNRAPGMTCLTSCENLERGINWMEATAKNSKGCGANMRVIPVGLMKFKHKGITDNDIAKWAQFQSAITHAHATALAASDLTAITIVKLIEGVQPENLLAELLTYAENQKFIYHEDYLGDIWQRPGIENAQTFIQRGWEECISSLLKVKKAVDLGDTTTDPCMYTGEGWVAEEAFATALLCFMYYPNDPVLTLQRAVHTSGDSDSIACLAGGFSGAHNGIDKFPTDWVERIEYQEDMESFIDFLVKN